MPPIRRLIVPALFLANVGLFALLNRGQARIDSPRLPGARPAIEAVEFPSLQAALDALPPEGGVVRLPAGTFEIAEPLTLGKGDVLLTGAGTATHIRNTNDKGLPALVIRHPDHEKDAKARLWRVQLENLRITGNPASGHGVEATGVDELFVSGVTVSEHGGDGLHLVDCYEDPRIVNSLITYNKATGLHLSGCHDIVVSANQFEENRDALRCLDGFNLCFNGNCVDDHLRHGVVIENTYGSVVAGNMIEECQGTGIVLDRDCYGITLSANVIAHEFGGGIDLADAHGCAVTGNSFPIVRPFALRIGPASGRITVTGNNFADSTIGPDSVKRLPDDQSAGGLVLEGTSDIAVSGNLFGGVTPKAVAVEGPTRRVLFDGNVLTDAESQHADLDDSNVADNLESAPE